MTNPRPEKVAAVEGLEQRLKASSVIILTDYRGLSVDEIGALRGRLRDADVEYRVTKNTLLALAAERCGLHGLSAYLNGPTAAVFGKDDPGVAARLLQDFIRQYRKLEIKGAVIDGEALDADAVRLLATLPSRPELQARAIAMIQAPLRSLVTVLNSSASALVYVIEAYRSRREAEEGVAAPSPAPATAEATEAPGVSIPSPATAEAAQPAAPDPAPVTAEAAAAASGPSPAMPEAAQPAAPGPAPVTAEAAQAEAAPGPAPMTPEAAQAEAAPSPAPMTPEAAQPAAAPGPAPVTAEAAETRGASVPSPVTAEAEEGATSVPSPATAETPEGEPPPSSAPGAVAAAEDSAPSGDTPALDVPTTPAAKDGAGSGDARST
jgi:large subunit ribosomal protein L10